MTATMTVADSSLSSLATHWWVAALGIMFLAAASGFGAGFACARWSDRRAFQRARTGVNRLFQTVLESIDGARDLCRLLERYPGKFLQTDQMAQLEKRQGGLLEAISRIVDRHADTPEPEPEALVECPPPPSPVITPRLNWLRNPVDPNTDLPDRSAFDANLKSLVEVCRAGEGVGSLLLIRVDKMSALAARYGQANLDKLLRRMAMVVCRASRDDDLVCRCNPETLGVLMPGIDLEAATRLGKVIRDSVRSAQFRIEETGPEVLFTASFGCTVCRPDENAELVFDRAMDALTKSQRLGRNHLHVHDGEALVHCTAG
jgi:diguanylate cyclase (GGDEF)-like protein